MSGFFQRLFAAASVLALALLVTSCGAGGAESAARKGFEEWAKMASVTYREPIFETISSRDDSATIKITAEFAQDEVLWLEQETTVQVVRRGNTWVEPTQFSFRLSPRAVGTQQAIQAVTATSEAAIREATASAEEAAYEATSTAVVATQVAQATSFVREVTATALAQATVEAVATQEAAVAAKTAVAEATEQAQARATEVAQRTTFVNAAPEIQALSNDTSEFRAYYKNVDFILVGVERAGSNSILWNFYVWNHNERGEFQIYPRGAYVVAQDGTKYDALQWQGVKTVAGERQYFTIAFNAPDTPEATYKLFLFTDLQAGSYYTSIEWQPIEVSLQ